MEYPVYEKIARPGNGESTEIADGITWLRMPLPYSLNHINLWLLRDTGGWVIIDTGINTRAGRETWEAAFGDTMANEPATHVIVTHLHPDHVGCAGWLVERFGVDLWMTREEYLLCRVLVADTGREAPHEGVDFYKAAGFSAEQLAMYRDNFGMFGRVVSDLPESYKRMRDGDKLHFAGYHWDVIVGRGHSPEHACLYDAERNILISGDQLLPTISPNISVWPTEPLANPLADWFASLDRLKQRMPPDVLVLPSHGKPFRGAHARLERLAQEHRTRLEQLVDACTEPRRVIDTFAHIYRRKITDDERIMATGEALAHLHYLYGTGDVCIETDADGVKWYRRR
jgi:glyoxylase-like metal-dependent hydrolase (beta-lactamase superfamily II)